MLDGNQRLTEDQALAIARELDRLGFTWFEQPIPQSDIAGYARLNAAVAMPITGSEQFTTLEQFRPYLEQRAYRIVQPDPGWCGITEGIKGEQVLLVAIPNTTYYESLVMTTPVVREPAVDAQGLVHAPTAPSIGFQAHWGDTPPWESGPLVE